VQWILGQQPQAEAVIDLAQQLNIPKIIASILLSRNISSFDDARYFFRAGYDDLYDPFLMKDMDKAAHRLIRAIEDQERILIYGDYDVDGTTAVSMLYLFLVEQGNDVQFYIPNRMKEGYGLSALGIERAADYQADLIITVDCGITAIEEVKLARQMGMDVIVSDHHEPGSALPEATAILDPKREDCPYPFKELAGVGVAFKLLQAVAQLKGLGEDYCRSFLDLVALGSVADIVPLIDENRVLVRLGLEGLNNCSRIGLNSLIHTSGLMGKSIGSGQIVFILAPRINAVGRMGNAERAVWLLVTEDEQEARQIADVLESENRTRKNIDEETFHQALHILEEEYEEGRDSSVVLAKEGWHSGVIGIVASRVAEHIYRPTIMIAMEDGVGKGSARSITNFDIYQALKECSDLLIDFGGHKYAAGLTIDPKNIPAFRKRLDKVAASRLQKEDFIQKVIYDAEISLSEITDKMIRLLKEFSPFGPQNIRPVFLSRDIQVVGTPRIVGNNHLKFRIRQGDKIFDSIGFDLGHLFYRLAPGEENLDMVYVVEENFWNGHSKIQLRVKDLR